MTFDQFIRSLKRQLGRSFSGKVMRSVGEIMVEVIVDRTRRGRGVHPQARRQGVGKSKRLKPLSPSYIEYRQRNAGRLDSTTSPRRSNLTFSGQLLRSMRVKEAKKGYVSVGPNSRLRAGGRGLTNEKLGRIVAEQGRPFNLLTKSDLKKVIRIFDETLKRNARKI